MTEAIMNEKYSLVKATSMRMSGFVPHRKCPYTQKDDIEHREWGCPEEKQEWEETNEHDITYSNSGAADASDSELLKNLWQGSNLSVTGETQEQPPAASASTAASPSGAINEWNSKVQSFIETRRVTHQRYVAMSLETREIITKMEEADNKYTKEILVDVKKHLVKVTHKNKSVLPADPAPNQRNTQLNKLNRRINRVAKMNRIVNRIESMEIEPAPRHLS